MKLFAAALVVAFALTLSGCTAGGFGVASTDIAKMTAEQLTANAKNKETGASCGSITAAGVSSNWLALNADKTVGTGGGRTTVKCAAGEVTFEDAGKAVTPPKSP